MIERATERKDWLTDMRAEPTAQTLRLRARGPKLSPVTTARATGQGASR